MITLVNFANSEFKNKRKWNVFTGKHIAGFDAVLKYSPEDINTENLDFTDDSFLKTKGYGNYFWKSIVINDALKRINEGDYLFYADSGSVFIRSIKPLINYLKEKNESILCFKFPLIEKQWTKRDAFVLMNCDYPEYTETSQVLGGFILMKKNKTSVDFIKKFQEYCSDIRIISDNENQMEKPNYPEFVEHRHDQSILSLMVKKYKILTMNDITDYGIFPEKYHQNKFLYNNKGFDSNGKSSKNVFILHNRKVSPIIYFAKFYVRLVLLKITNNRKNSQL